MSSIFEQALDYMGYVEPVTERFANAETQYMNFDKCAVVQEYRKHIEAYRTAKKK